MRIAGSVFGIKPNTIDAATDYLASEDTSNWPSINDPTPTPTKTDVKYDPDMDLFAPQIPLETANAGFLRDGEQIAALPAGLAVGAAKAVGALSALQKANLLLNGGSLADGTLDAFNSKGKPRRAQDYPVLNQF